MVHFFPQKVDDLFLVVVVTFKPTLNVQTSKQRGTNLAVDRGGSAGAAGAPPMVSHGTTGTVVNPALRSMRKKTDVFGILIQLQCETSLVLKYRCVRYDSYFMY